MRCILKFFLIRVIGNVLVDLTSEFQFHNSKKVCFMNNIKNIQEVTGHDEEAMLRLSRGMCIHEV